MGWASAHPFLVCTRLIGNTGSFRYMGTIQTLVDYANVSFCAERKSFVLESRAFEAAKRLEGLAEPLACSGLRGKPARRARVPLGLEARERTSSSLLLW